MKFTFGLLLFMGAFILAFSPNATQAQWFMADTRSPDIYGVVGDVSYGCAWGDYDNDGFQDLFVANYFTSGGCYLFHDDNGVFADSGGQVGIRWLGNTATAACWGDYDNDGFLDLYVACGEYGGFQNVLFDNNGPDSYGHYRFVVSPNQSVVGDNGDTRDALWGDFNNDGFLDLYIANKGSLSKMFSYTGTGFVDQPCLPRAVNMAEGAVAADFDNDGDLDLYICNDNAYDTGNRLYRNQLKETGQQWLFTEEATQLGVLLDDIRCQSASFCDYDGDGLLDLYVNTLANYRNYLFHNEGTGGFLLTTFAQSPGNIGSGWGDFDLDGDFDLYSIGAVGEPDYFWLNRWRELNYDFQDRTANAGVRDAEWSLSTEWADYDNDGKPDIFTGNLPQNPGETNKLYLNVDSTTNRYLQIKLLGSTSNRDGIGAHIVLRYNQDGSWVQQLAEVSGGGNGGGSQGSLPIEFGTGTVTNVDSVMVYWPAGDTSIFEDVPTNQRITIVEQGVFDHDLRADMTWDKEIFGDYYISGDVSFRDGFTLTINRGTKVFFHKTWRTNVAPKMQFEDYSSLIINGTSQEPAALTSQYLTPHAGDWTGIVLIGVYPNNIQLNYCTVEYASIGLFSPVVVSPDHININHCNFGKMVTAGIDLWATAYLSETAISDCDFISCGSYGVRIRRDQSPYPEITISGCYMEDCDYGIWYSGNSDANQRALNLANNQITLTAPSTQSQYGIYITRYDAAGQMPIAQMDGNTVQNYRQGGIWLNYTHPKTSIKNSHVYLCGIYGLRFSFASASVMGQDYSAYNSFDSCYYGMHFDQNSTGTIRWTRLKGNTGYGAMFEFQSTLPRRE
jgi:hypothetical protein